MATPLREAAGPAPHDHKPVARREGLELAIRRGGRRGLGEVILNEQDPALVAGVRIVGLAVWPDDRGYFLEVARLGQELAQGFEVAVPQSGSASPDPVPPGRDGPAPRIGASLDVAASASVQVSATLSYPGTIKALHYHCRQTDLWAPVAGMLQVCLYDLRVDAPTFGRTNTLYIGHLRPWELRIPPGIAHGYKVLGNEPALLVYVTDRFYDPSDEGRLPYDDPDINYDWEPQHR